MQLTRNFLLSYVPSKHVTTYHYNQRTVVPSYQLSLSKNYHDFPRKKKSLLLAHQRLTLIITFLLIVWTSCFLMMTKLPIVLYGSLWSRRSEGEDKTKINLIASRMWKVGQDYFMFVVQYHVHQVAFLILLLKHHL